MVIEGDPTSGKEDWMEKYTNYLTQGVLPVDNNEARVFKMKASRFIVLDDVLFKKYATVLLQRCLNTEEARQVLRDIHEGECENHSGGRNLSRKVLRMVYYWESLKEDALNYIRKCDAC
ncbi:uncharacterized protein LOC141719512 [Apium graveolens]|uniref:uncharacterized protein LOC141719512 n=1 Tax=Apium graveolens TaxID=4045 RepID=UPI003D7AE537